MKSVSKKNPLATPPFETSHSVWKINVSDLRDGKCAGKTNAVSVSAGWGVESVGHSGALQHREGEIKRSAASLERRTGRLEHSSLNCRKNLPLSTSAVPHPFAWLMPSPAHTDLLKNINQPRAPIYSSSFFKCSIAIPQILCAWLYVHVQACSLLPRRLYLSFSASKNWEMLCAISSRHLCFISPPQSSLKPIVLVQTCTSILFRFYSGSRRGALELIYLCPHKHTHPTSFA